MNQCVLIYNDQVIIMSECARVCVSVSAHCVFKCSVHARWTEAEDAFLLQSESEILFLVFIRTNMMLPYGAAPLITRSAAKHLASC